MFKSHVLLSKNGGYMNFLREAPKRGKGAVHTKSVNGCRGSYKKYWKNRGTRDGTRSDTNQTEFGLGIKLGGGLFGNRKSRSTQLKNISANMLDLEIYGNPNITNPFFVDGDNDSIMSIERKLSQKEELLVTHHSIRREAPMRLITVLEMPLVGTNELERYIKIHRRRNGVLDAYHNTGHVDNNISRYTADDLPGDSDPLQPAIEKNLGGDEVVRIKSTTLNYNKLQTPLPKLWGAFLPKLATMIRLHLKIQENGQEAGLVLATNFVHTSIDFDRLEKEMMLMMTDCLASRNSPDVKSDNNYLDSDVNETHAATSKGKQKTHIAISTFIDTFARSVMEDLLSQHYKHYYALKSSTITTSESLKRMGLKFNKSLVVTEGKSLSDTNVIVSSSEVPKERRGCTFLFSLRNKAMRKPSNASNSNNNNNNNNMATYPSDKNGAIGLPSMKRRPALSLSGVGSSPNVTKNRNESVVNSIPAFMSSAAPHSLLIRQQLNENLLTDKSSDVSECQSINRSNPNDNHSNLPNKSYHVTCYVPLFCSRKGGLQHVLQRISSNTKTTNGGVSKTLREIQHTEGLCQSIDNGRLQMTQLNPFQNNDINSNHIPSSSNINSNIGINSGVFLGRKYPGSHQIGFSTCMYVIPSYLSRKLRSHWRGTSFPPTREEKDYHINLNTKSLSSKAGTAITTLLSSESALSFKTLLHWTTLNKDTRHCPTEVKYDQPQYGDVHIMSGESSSVLSKHEPFVGGDTTRTSTITTQRTPIEIVNVIRCVSPRIVRLNNDNHDEETNDNIIHLVNEKVSEGEEQKEKHYDSSEPAEKNMMQKKPRRENVEYEMRETLSFGGTNMTSMSNSAPRTFRAEVIDKALSSFEKISQLTAETLMDDNVGHRKTKGRKLTAKNNYLDRYNKRKVSELSLYDTQHDICSHNKQLDELTSSINDEVLDPVAKFLRKNYGIRPIREDAWGLLCGLVDRSSDSISLRDKEREEVQDNNNNNNNFLTFRDVVTSTIDDDNSERKRITELRLKNALISGRDVNSGNVVFQ